MYFATSSPVTNCVIARLDTAVAATIIRPSSVLRRSMLGMPSAATSMIPSQPSIRMMPRSAPFCSSDGSVRRFAEM